MLLNGTEHVPGLMRNLISLVFLHEKGWLYQTADKNTLRVMHGGYTILVSEKSDAHQQYMKDNVVEGGSIEWQCFCSRDSATVGLASLSYLE